MLLSPIENGAVKVLKKDHCNGSMKGKYTQITIGIQSLLYNKYTQFQSLTRTKN